MKKYIYFKLHLVFDIYYYFFCKFKLYLFVIAFVTCVKGVAQSNYPQRNSLSRSSQYTYTLHTLSKYSFILFAFIKWISFIDVARNAKYV